MQFSLLIDECVNSELVTHLRQVGADVQTVPEVGLRGATDDEVFEFATKNKTILVTYDREFGDIFRFKIEDSYGLIVILIGQLSRREEKIVMDKFLEAVGKEENLKGKLAILGKNRVRLVSR